jgi:putative methionine-R-sulfoxide reductase with GAF domain
MEKHSSLIKIEDKLKSFSLFSGSSGTLFYTGDRIYAFPKELEKTINERIESRGDINVTGFLEDRKNVKTITLQSGKLIFIDSSTSIEERTLHFLGEELEEEIKLTSVFDNISQASVAISSNLDLKSLLHKVMSYTEEILNNEVSAVMLLDPEKKELYWEVSRGEKSEYFEGKQTLPLGHGIAGHVAQTGEAVLLNDVNKDPRWDSSYDEKTGFRTRSMICMPVKFHGDILGVIEVINKKAGEFTSRDLWILEVLAAQTGAAIENAKIHGKLEEAHKELKLLDMDRGVLGKVFLGLLKNAIENTPDEGKIEVTATSKEGEIRIGFHDWGVGITEQNQKMIFGGFFHTQETELYSSKRPYEFNAGGTGSDLLRIKSFSERFGFLVDFESTRCRFIPSDRDRCPGKISSCPFISDKLECFSSGASTFLIRFPQEQ